MRLTALDVKGSDDGDSPPTKEEARACREASRR
jgi:hypothetical protein